MPTDGLSGAGGSMILNGLRVDNIGRVALQVAQNVINGAGKRSFVVLHGDKTQVRGKDNVFHLQKGMMGTHWFYREDIKTRTSNLSGL